MVTTRSPSPTTRGIEVELLPARSGRRFVVAVADGRSLGDRRAAASPLIYFPALRDCLDDRQRIRLLAQRTGRLVVSAQLPGHAGAGVALRPTQRLSLLAGNFGPIAEEAIRAIADALGEWGPARGSGPSPARLDGPASLAGLDGAILLGSSLGASLAGAAARVMLERGWGRPGRLVLIEPVAVSARPLPALALAEYLDSREAPNDPANGSALEGLDHPPAPRTAAPPTPATRARRSGWDRAWFAVGISAGGIPRDLARIVRRPDRITIDLVRGGRSRFVPAARLARVHDALRRAGVAGELIVVPQQGHRVWQDPDTMAYLADRLLR